jgi:hypothetical protein
LSFGFVVGQTFGKDFVHKIWGGDVTKLTRIGLVVAGTAAVLIAIFKRSVVAIRYDLGSISTGALLIPLVTSFTVRWRMRPNAAFAAVIAGGKAVILRMILGYIAGQERFLGIDTIYAGLVFSGAVYVAESFFRN